jgi:hypothetical protein
MKTPRFLIGPQLMPRNHFCLTLLELALLHMEHGEV